MTITCPDCNYYPCACGGERKNMEAPERLYIFRRVGADEWHIGDYGETMSWGNAQGEQYVRADIHDAAKGNETALAHAHATLTARVAELEAGIEALPDMIDIYRLIKFSGARKHADIARVVAERIQPIYALYDPEAARAALGKGE